MLTSSPEQAPQRPAPAADFKLRDSGSYDQVADSFAAYTNRFTVRVAQRLVELAAIDSGDRVLDIGCGSGVVAIQAGLRARTKGSVLGIDLSEGLMSIAKHETHRAELGAVVRYERMDAEHLALPDGSFDKVVSLFALLHLPDPLRGLREMFRVLRPGGTLAIGVGSGVPLWSSDAIRHGFELIPEKWSEFRGRRLRAPDFLDSLVRKHIPGSEDAEETSLAAHGHHRSGAVLGLVRQAGFNCIRRSWQRYQATLPTTEEFFDLQRTYSSLSRKRLLGASDSQRRNVRREFESRGAEVLARGGHLVYPYAALFIVANRP